MASAWSAIFTFCFVWVAVYLFLRFLHAVWTVTEHFNWALSPAYRSRHKRGTLDLALDRAAKLMGWGATVALPVGTVSLLAALFQ
jgi:hypothetical protein